MTDRGGDRRTGKQAAVVAQSLVALADTFVDGFDAARLFDRLVADSVHLLEVSAAAILLVNHDRTLEMVASSDGVSRLADVLRHDSEAVPSARAMRTGEAVSITDPAELRRLCPDLGTAVEEFGFTAVYALPMQLREERIGVLNLFDAGRPPLSDLDHRLAQALADVTTIAVLQRRALANASVLAGQLQRALDTRIVVEQAKGVIAEFGGVDIDTAFEVLRGYARCHRRTVRTVAQLLVSRELDPGWVIPARPAR